MFGCKIWPQQSKKIKKHGNHIYSNESSNLNKNETNLFHALFIDIYFNSHEKNSFLQFFLSSTYF